MALNLGFEGSPQRPDVSYFTIAANARFPTLVAVHEACSIGDSGLEADIHLPQNPTLAHPPMPNHRSQP